MDYCIRNSPLRYTLARANLSPLHRLETSSNMVILLLSLGFYGASYCVYIAEVWPYIPRPYILHSPCLTCKKRTTAFQESNLDSERT